MIKYFRELLKTLKSIDAHLEKISSCVITHSGQDRAGPQVRVNTSKYS